MIKEIGHEVNDQGYCKFGSMKLVDGIKDPYNYNIPLNDFNKFYKDELDKMGIVNLKKTTRFKHGDWIQLLFHNNHIMCVSKRFKSICEGKLKGYWYPTTDKEYFIFLLDNYVDAFDMNKTIITYEDNHPNIPWSYWYIKNEKFKKEVEKEEYLFAIKQESNYIFSTPKFEKLLVKNDLNGFIFFKELMFMREGRKYSVDRSRRNSYDKEGNLI
jgi:hypothetical protein